MEEKQITFGQLSLSLKIAIVMAWVVGILWAISMMVGYVIGLIYY